MKLKTIILSLSLVGVGGFLTTSCDDMLDKGNDYVIYSDGRVLYNPADTATSVMGILNKLQAIAVRTNLFGELRGDLVVTRSNATIDLKDIAEFNVGDDNRYNNPRDYYAIINNCNFFLERADSTAGNVNRNEKYFEAEIAQVHSIRAWTYLQLAKVYGRVPLVTEPVLTKLQSEATYPMLDLGQICDYFIDDLKPYYAKEYPGYVSIGGDIDPQLCFFPSQVVMGDMLLWKAAIAQNKDIAKQAAKCYYDYIIWDLGGKTPLTTGEGRNSWSASALEEERYNSRETVYQSVGGNWGAKNNTTISAIPMDSASSCGFYNELRNFYNTTYKTTKYEEASIEPSQSLKDLSAAQTYIDYNTKKEVTTVNTAKFTEEQLEKGYQGDLRYSANFSTSTGKYNNQEVEYQSNYKHDGQHIGIYRAHQIYLRLAEALNYAGYPRFARQILIMGLSNNVINYEVLPYYRTADDSAFIKQFDFNNNTFMPVAENYTQTTNAVGMITKVSFQERASDVNMIGIHSRGSGLAYLNADYLPLAKVDSTLFPFALKENVGAKPLLPPYVEPTQPCRGNKPSTWADTPMDSLSLTAYIAYHSIRYDTDSYKKRAHTTYDKYRDSVDQWIVYYDVTLPAAEAEYAAVEKQYNIDFAAYSDRLNAFTEAYQQWLTDQYSNAALIAEEQAAVDQAILDEQALELAYEGNRYYDLMRRAYWWNDNNRLIAPISKRTSSASKLNNRTDWFIKWKGQIGY